MFYFLFPSRSVSFRHSIGGREQGGRGLDKWYQPGAGFTASSIPSRREGGCGNYTSIRVKGSAYKLFNIVKSLATLCPFWRAARMYDAYGEW